MKKLVVVFFIFLTAPSAFTQPQEPKLLVATRLIKPFVFEESGQLTGFRVEFWQELAKDMNVKSEFVIKPTVAELLDSVRLKEVALGIAAISVTAEREVNLDFSQPMFDAGLQIMIAARGSEQSVIANFIAGIFSRTFLPLVELILLTILIPAHLVWFFERRHSAGALTHTAYFHGIFEACWWSVATLATQADHMPRSAAARLVAVIWMFTSVIFIAYFTATVTSALTLQQLRSDINGPNDLSSKHVASVRGSTAVEYLQRRRIAVTEFANVEEAYRPLEQGQADAIVYDAPVLLYYAAHEGKGKVQVVGSIFRKEDYGIVFPSESAYRKPVNEALLKMKENGINDRLYKKWFGSNGS